MKYKVSISRKSSGMDFESATMTDALHRISIYNLDFPGEIVNVTIDKIA